MTVFEFRDYKLFMRDRIAAMPKKGRGELQRIAAALRMHPTRISQVVNSSIDLTPEQASALCKFWGLNQLEAEFFLVLVQLARAGTKDLQQLLESQAEGIRGRAKQLVNRLPRDRVLSESEKAVFYSSWLYSGIRMLTSIEEFQTVDAIAKYLSIPRARCREILEFLVSTGLCAEENQRYRMGHKLTHLEATSPLVRQHHANWRLKALTRHENLSERELAYTSPASLSRADQKRLREMLVQTVEKFLKTVTASEPAEVVSCLTIDWFEF